MQTVVKSALAALLTISANSVFAELDGGKEWVEEVEQQLLERFDANTNRKLDPKEIHHARSRLRYLMEDASENVLVIEEWREDLRGLLSTLDRNDDGELDADERKDARFLLGQLLPKPEEADAFEFEDELGTVSDKPRPRRSRSRRGRRTFGGVGQGATAFGPGVLGPPRPFFSPPQFPVDSTGEEPGLQNVADEFDVGTGDAADLQVSEPEPGEEYGSGFDEEFGAGDEPGSGYAEEFGAGDEPGSGYGEEFDEFEDGVGDAGEPAEPDEDGLFPEDEFAADIEPVGDGLAETVDGYAEPEGETEGGGEEVIRREEEPPPPAF